jgi:hypothetical protein
MKYVKLICVIVLVLIMAVGIIANDAEFFKSDWQSPWHDEVTSILCLVSPGSAAVAGFLNFNWDTWDPDNVQTCCSVYPVVDNDNFITGDANMKLLTKEIRKKLPRLYAQDGKGDNAIVYLKFFTPDNNWTWFITEGEPVLSDTGEEVDFEFFGMVHGLENELGYFRLSQLQTVRGCLGLPIERDMYWKPETLGNLTVLS